MNNTLISMTAEKFDSRFPLVENHLNPLASWAFDDNRGCLFETYGEEYEFVLRQDRTRIWTITEGDDGDWYIVSGLHFVNRVGYLISREPVPSGVSIEVHVPLTTE